MESLLEILDEIFYYTKWIDGNDIKGLRIYLDMIIELTQNAKEILDDIESDKKNEVR